MKFPSHYLIFSAIFMLLVSNSRAQKSPSKLVEDICNQVAKFPEIKFEDCVEGLKRDPKTAEANLITLAKISIQLGLSNAINTQNYIQKMVNSSSTNLNLQKPLKTCLFWYQAVIGSFRSAIQELEEDPLTANYDVKIAGDDAKECEDELARNKAKIPPIITRNNYVKLYSSIGFVITDRL